MFQNWNMIMNCCLINRTTLAVPAHSAPQTQAQLIMKAPDMVRYGTYKAKIWQISEAQYCS
jgi:hypothetical protein